MELVKDTIPSKVVYLGAEIFDLPANKKLMIKRTGGDDILNAQVPKGKSWEVHVHLEVIESDE